MAYNSYFDSFELPKSSHELLWNEMSSSRSFLTNKEIIKDIVFSFKCLSTYAYKKQMFCCNQQKAVNNTWKFYMTIHIFYGFEGKKDFQRISQAKYEVEDWQHFLLVENSFMWKGQKINRYFLQIVIETSCFRLLIRLMSIKRE